MALLLTAVCSSPAVAAPDILFIVADDLGYNEVNFMNDSRGILTPELDKLASGGVTLTNYYVQPICSPTRSALMTGRYPLLLGTQSNVIYWDTPWAVPKNHTFLPELLQQAGFETALFGKWVCRSAPQTLDFMISLTAAAHTLRPPIGTASWHVQGGLRAVASRLQHDARLSPGMRIGVDARRGLLRRALRDV